MIKLTKQTYRNIILIITTVAIINIIKPDSFFKSIGIALLLGIIFGIGIGILEVSSKKRK